jgi:hypothetical protein
MTIAAVAAGFDELGVNKRALITKTGVVLRITV